MGYNEFRKIFPVNNSYDEEVQIFINRVSDSIFDYFDNWFEFETRKVVISKICLNLGLRKHIYIYEDGMYDEVSTSPLANIPNGDFIKVLGVIVMLRQHLLGHEPFVRYIDENVENFIELSNGKLNIKWTNGVFYPAGDTLLDKVLIEETLSYLTDFKNEKMDLTNALSNYQAGRFPDVGPNCFKCIEGLGREILLNNNNLDNNKAEIFKYMEFSSRWNSMFSNFIPYIHEHRHASEGRHDLKNIELESMLYMTCLFVRAICLIYIEKKIA